MRIKIGNEWFECQPGRPVMVELNEQDKVNLANMAPEATKYACFDDSDTTSDEQKLDWMKA